MTRFQVWAPKAEEVRVRIGEQDHLMHAGQPGERGWWSLDLPEAGAGAEYSFILDGGSPLPDPRSPWQPHGVHGPSRMVDHSAFSWSDQNWNSPPLAAGIIYEIHTGSFTPEGTFDSAVARLNYLVDIGVTHVELMPVAEFSGLHGWGYDGVDLYAPHHRYGGPDGLKRLVDACHARGLAVILDVVYNHLGPDGNYLGLYGPYFTDRYATPWGEAVNLDGPGSDEVRRFFIDNALMWLRDYHIDGLRLDAVHSMVDTSAVHFLEQLAAEVDDLEVQLDRPLVLIAESDMNNPRLIQPVQSGGYGIDASWNDDFHHALHTLITGERDGYYMDFGSMADLAQALKGAYVYDGRYSEFRQRRHGRPATGLSGAFFLSYLQNHDQIGNRAQGERIGHLVNPGLAKIGAALVLASPFIPLLFQGEEWGASTPFLYFTNYENTELGKAVSEGRRQEFAPFGWDLEKIPDPQNRETFERSKLKWEELEQGRHQEMLDWYRQWIRMRRKWPALQTGPFDRVDLLYDPEQHWLILDRKGFALICNISSEAQEVLLPEECRGSLLLASDPQASLGPEAVRLPPYSAALVGAISTALAGPKNINRVT